MTLKFTLAVALFFSSLAFATGASSDSADGIDSIRLPPTATYKDCATAILERKFAQEKGIDTFRVTSFKTEWSGFLGLGSGFLIVNGTLDPAGAVKVSGHIYTSLEDGYGVDPSTGQKSTFKICKLQNVCDAYAMDTVGENFTNRVLESKNICQPKARPN